MKNEDKLLEELADLEHKQWAHITLVYIKESLVRFALNMPKRVREMNTPYKKLTEEEKEMDRYWARKVLAIVKKYR